MNPPCTSASACALTPLNAMNDNPADPRRKTRTTHSISFKIDVCEYWRRIPNPTIAGCARHYAITEKQVRYFRRNEEFYRSVKNRRMRRTAIRPEQIRMRAKYSDQEQRVFAWFLESRAQGKNIYD
jgi:hypothetical protein